LTKGFTQSIKYELKRHIWKNMSVWSQIKQSQSTDYFLKVIKIVKDVDKAPNHFIDMESVGTGCELSWAVTELRVKMFLLLFVEKKSRIDWVYMQTQMDKSK
jgi:hypothetical protein